MSTLTSEKEKNRGQCKKKSRRKGFLDRIAVENATKKRNLPAWRIKVLL